MAGNVGSRAFQNARLQKKHRKQADALQAAALAAYRAGRHAEAQAGCAQILALLPDHVEALQLLGRSFLDTGRFAEAEAALSRAAAIEPREAEVQANLGIALFNLGRFEEARKHQERAVALKPNFVAAITALGNTLWRLSEFEQAIAAHDRAIALKPDYADAYCNRGVVQLLLDRNADAERSFDRALSFDPRHMQALFGKGLVGLNLRRHDAALAAFNAALAVKPDAAVVIAQRGRLYMQAGRLDEAAADFDAALARDPRLEPALLGKAHIGILKHNVAPAMEACRKVLEQNPNSEAAWMWLGAGFAQQGEVATALAHFDRSLEIKPDYADAIVAKIFTLDFLPEADFAIQQATRRQWWERVGARLPRFDQSPRVRDPERRITIGYVSSDFRNHSAAFAFLPVLRHHDHSQFQVICYSCFAQQDDVTAVCRAAADVWVDASQMSDDELAGRIDADQVDILVDLSGHSVGNRLAVFARKPAPIQVSGWGNGTGTGLPTIDYFFGDPVTMPQAVRPLFAEEIYDLPSVITTEPSGAAAPTPLPLLRNGHVTFGVFNRIDKISDPALAVWSRLLQELPEARIVVKNAALDDAFLRDRLVGRFAAHGVAPERILCLGSSPRDQHLAEFARIDISLDPFPQNGGVSTWESLQAGVPVVAKLGASAASRAAGAIVSAIGLTDWVAADDSGYIAIARRFASDPTALAAVRAELPQRVATSAAGNVALYTRKVEEGYRSFWRRYCANNGG